MRIDKKIDININVYFAIIVYKCLLDFIYLKEVHPIYGYMGFENNFNMSKYVISWILFIGLYSIIPKEKKRVSNMVLQLHYMLMIVPMYTIYAFCNMSSKFMLMIAICFYIEIIILKNSKLIKIKQIRNAKMILTLFISICTVVTYSTMLVSNGIHIEALNFNNVYEIREQIIYPVSLVQYLHTWQYSIINPYVIVSSWFNNKKGISLIFLILQFILYLITPFKSILFSVLLIIGLLLIINRKSFLKVALYFMSFAITISTLINKLGLSLMLFALLPVRLLFVPALIKFRHYEVFTHIYDKLHYSEGIIGKILGIVYPFDKPSGYIVGSVYGIQSNENTGYLAYAYDNGGFIAMIIMSFLFILIMLLIDSLCNNKNKNIVFSLIALQMIMLNDGDILTLLLTGGLFITIIILFLDRKL